MGGSRDAKLNAAVAKQLVSRVVCYVYLDDAGVDFPQCSQTVPAQFDGVSIVSGICL